MAIRITPQGTGAAFRLLAYPSLAELRRVDRWVQVGTVLAFVMLAVVSTAVASWLPEPAHRIARPWTAADDADFVLAAVLAAFGTYGIWLVLNRIREAVTVPRVLVFAWRGCRLVTRGTSLDLRELVWSVGDGLVLGDGQHQRAFNVVLDATEQRDLDTALRSAREEARRRFAGQPPDALRILRGRPMCAGSVDIWPRHR